MIGLQCPLSPPPACALHVCDGEKERVLVSCRVLSCKMPQIQNRSSLPRALCCWFGHLLRKHTLSIKSNKKLLWRLFSHSYSTLYSLGRFIEIQSNNQCYPHTAKKMIFILSVCVVLHITVNSLIFSIDYPVFCRSFPLSSHLNILMYFSHMFNLFQI